MGYEEANVIYNQSIQPSSVSSSLSQRRRSLAYSRPPAPPPNLPIPSVPDQLQDSFPVRVTLDSSDHPFSSAISPHGNGSFAQPVSYARPSASPNLTSIAAFSHNLNAKPGSVMTSAPVEDLSDPPPSSFLPSSPKRVERRRRRSDEDGLLSPTTAERRERAPSSRSALTRALELARQAVHLDSTNDNPTAAVEAYAQSVALLSQVMERVKRGEDGGKRVRSPEAQEEEVRRLQNIHDTYADRMNILSIIYGIPATPYASSAYIPSSAIPSSPNSGSSSSTSHIAQPNDQPQNGASYFPDGRIGNHDIDTGEIMREAMFPVDDAPPSGPALHPYASQHDSRQEQNYVKLQSRFSSGPTARRRAGSNLLPPTPPPVESLPQAPLPGVTDLGTAPSEYLGHRRNGSGRLARLDEKDEVSVDGQIPFARERSDSEPVVPDTPRDSRRDSHPLPPIPTPEADSFETTGSLRGMPRKTPPSPRLSNSQRPRASSQLQGRSDTPAHPFINPSPKDGVIFLRRTQTSAPSSMRSPSPIDPQNTVPGRSIASSLLGSTVVMPPTGRLRSSSQPGRKPTGQISPSEQRPPLPSSIGQNGTARKTSIPSKLNPNSAFVPLTVQTDIMSPTTSIMQSVGFPSAFVTTPTSPLPPAPPTDSLRKPYYMMNLLRVTMTSHTGGYLTRRLHIPFEVWSQGGAKLANIPEKIRVVAILSSALEDLQVSSAEYFGAGNVSSGLALGIGSVGRKEAEGWIAKLDDFAAVCDGIEANFGKKLGVGEGFVPKRNALTGLAKKIDKFTTGKNLDSPTVYVQGLKVLLQHAQLLDEHTQAVVSVSPAYAAFPQDVRISAEYKLKRFSEFFATVVLAFVIRDLSQLLDKYVKKCEKWLAE
ncbi:hypothetical protein AX15_001107 [Amanita polypyramis BW_CC]|nr:hypothetical protein AX15_001107 [Amanita polypyramis BW_CC]